MVTALLLATFIVVPMAGVFLCASESGDRHSYVEIYSADDDSRDKSSGSDYSHGVCGSGHCHHVHDQVASTSASEVTSLHVAHQWPASDAITPHTPNGLIRPPKA